MALLEQFLSSLGESGEVNVVGDGGLPSVFAVDELATASIAAASVAVASLHAARTGEPPRVTVDRAHAAIAFQSERHLAPAGWTLPPAWDPIAGDYATRDGKIRIHTNYAWHRAAALGVLDVAEERAAVAAAVATWTGDALEAAIVAAGGAAARHRTLAAWAEHPQGIAVAAEPLVAREARSGAPPLAPGTGLDGIRVLDLTRVIAGPVCTRVLAAYGADVLRLDPPGFAEVGALLPETTAGKRRAALDLRTDAATFAKLVEEADVVVCGYRGGALDPALLAACPTVVLLDAYGWTGPWQARRGFDSLVQASSGIAAREEEARGATGLPAQALDHGAGYLLAAATCSALRRRVTDGVGSVTRLSLARLARSLVDRGEIGDPQRTPPDPAPFREHEDSGFGPLARVRIPGTIAGLAPHWSRPAGPLGTDPATWGQPIPSR